MSIVAISDTLGSLGHEIGRRVASARGFALADREIIARTAERFHEGVVELTHVTEERPTLWERLTDSQHRYMTYVEAVLLELAARDDVVLLGRGAAVILRGIPHVLRVRITAPEDVRAERLQNAQGLTRDAALDSVRQSDRERGARLKFLYHVDWDDALLYDLALNTARLDAEQGARLVLPLLEERRFRSSEEGRRRLGDLSLAAQAKAILLADPLTRQHQILASCHDGRVTLTGSVRDEAVRQAAERAVAEIPGVAHVVNDIACLQAGRSLAGRI